MLAGSGRKFILGGLWFLLKYLALASVKGRTPDNLALILQLDFRGTQRGCRGSTYTDPLAGSGH